MDYDKLIDAVKLCGNTPKVDQCKQCAYWAGGDMSKCIPKMTADAALAIETLRADLASVTAERDAAVETVKQIPVVRCRECKYWTEDAEWCREFSFFITPSGEPCSPAESMNWRSFQADDFCSYGVRKETEGEA